MPHEAFPIVKGSSGFNRQKVGDKIAQVFDLIAEHGGKYIATLEFVEQEYNAPSGGTPSSIVYVVADFKEPFDRDGYADIFKVDQTYSSETNYDLSQ